MMQKAHGWRKVLVFTEALVAFVIVLWLLQLKDPAAIIAVGSMIIGLVASTIYGNVKVHQAYAPTLKPPTEATNG